MIEPITPVPLFKVSISPVGRDEYDSAIIASKDKETLTYILEADDFWRGYDRIEFLQEFDIDGEQHIVEITEIGTYTLGIPDDEVYGALKPLILKKAKKELGEVLGEIAYMDDNMSVILRKDGIFSSCIMSVRTRVGDNYSADYNHKSGRIDLGRVPALLNRVKQSKR